MTANAILIIEDSPSLARTYQGQLKDEAKRVEIAEDGRTAERLMAELSPDCVLLDVNLPDADGLEMLRAWRAAGVETPIIVITANGSINTAVAAMRDGAEDFLVKPFGADRARTTVRNALETARLKKTVAAIEKTARKEGFADFVGASLPMQALYQAIQNAAPSTASILITGETGVGKELAARAVHSHSGRARRPFIAVNCGAIPRDLIESELFGHVKGAFTGATSDRAGAAELADGGTLFLDEIGEMPIELQPKLLRFLQTGGYARVGDSRQRAADIRIVAATNRAPWQAVRDGRLREDLYFRLNVVQLELPALRERGSDILLLARYFLEKYAKEEGGPARALDGEAEQSLLAHPWPGNVRELENVMRRALIMAQGEQIGAADLALTPAGAPIAPVSPPASPSAEAFAMPAPTPGPVPASPGHAAQIVELRIEPLWRTEQRAIEHAIALAGNNVSEAAKGLGIAPSTIYRKREQWKALEAEASQPG